MLGIEQEAFSISELDQNFFMAITLIYGPIWITTDPPVIDPVKYFSFCTFIGFYLSERILSEDALRRSVPDI